MSYSQTPPIETLTGLGPEDTDGFLEDFSGNLRPGDSIVELVSIVATPAGMTISSPAIIAGSSGLANTAVAFLASVGTPSLPGAVGIYYQVSTSVVTAFGYSRTRSMTIPIISR